MLRFAKTYKVELSLRHLEGEYFIVKNPVKEFLSEVDPIKAYINQVDLSAVDPFNAYHSLEEMRRANLSQANLSQANLSEANLNGADLRQADLSSADLHGANLSQANFSGANLYGANLGWSDLAGANLTGAVLRQASMHSATLNGADFSNAVLENANLLGADLRATRLCNANLFHVDGITADFTGADLSGAELESASLTGARFVGAILSKANLRRANLVEANLSRAVLTGARLAGTNLARANLSGADLSGADLQTSLMVETCLENATLSGCHIFGISAWGLKLREATQKDLVITRSEEPEIMVDNLEVAQFIYLLLNNEKIRNVINTVTSKVVLILGRFTPERKTILDALRDTLRERNYLPVVFDFNKPASRDLTETVSTLAHLARFIIADITDPRSIPQEFQAIVPHLAVPVQPIIAHPQQPWGMFVDFPKKYHWVLEAHEYTDLGDLLGDLQTSVIAPAEAKAKQLAAR